MRIIVAVWMLLLSSFSWGELVPLTDADMSNVSAGSIHIEVLDSSPAITQALQSSDNAVKLSIAAFGAFIPPDWNIYVTLGGVTYPNGIDAITFLGNETIVTLPDFRYITIRNWLPGADPGTLSFLNVQSHGSTLHITYH